MGETPRSVFEALQDKLDRTWRANYSPYPPDWAIEDQAATRVQWLERFDAAHKFTAECREAMAKRLAAKAEVLFSISLPDGRKRKSVVCCDPEKAADKDRIAAFLRHLADEIEASGITWYTED